MKGSNIMAATKKAVTETKAVKETEVKTAPKSEVKAETKAAPKAEKKTPAKKPAAKKSPAKKTAKTDVKKENVLVQFSGKEYDIDSIVTLAKADFKANNKGCVRSINVYVKPEDSAAYYVVNGKTEGKVDL